MHRPNLAMDEPPTELIVGGAAYSIDTDYRTWLLVLDDLKGLLPRVDNTDDALHNAQVILTIEQRIMGAPMPELNPNEVLLAVTEFADGYPQAPVSGGGESSSVRRYSFDWDINAIVLAIRNQSGIDISYARRGPFHWWLFLEEFRTLCGEHYILHLMEVRGYDGKDNELRKQAVRFALPREHTAAERQISEEIDDLFYNA